MDIQKFLICLAFVFLPQSHGHAAMSQEAHYILEGLPLSMQMGLYSGDLGDRADWSRLGLSREEINELEELCEQIEMYLEKNRSNQAAISIDNDKELGAYLERSAQIIGPHIVVKSVFKKNFESVLDQIIDYIFPVSKQRSKDGAYATLGIRG